MRGGYDLKNHEVIVADNRNEVAIWCQEVLNERVYSNEYVEAVKNRWGYSYVLHLSFVDEGALIAFKLAWQ